MSCRPARERERASPRVGGRSGVADPWRYGSAPPSTRQAPLTRVVERRRRTGRPGRRTPCAIRRAPPRPSAVDGRSRRHPDALTCRQLRGARAGAAPAHPGRALASGPIDADVGGRRHATRGARDAARARRRPPPRAPRGWPGATARRAPARAAPRCAPAPRARAARRCGRARSRRSRHSSVFRRAAATGAICAARAGVRARGPSARSTAA